MNVLSDGYVAGIVAHLSKNELDKYDRELGGKHPELEMAHPLDSQGKFERKISMSCLQFGPI